VCRITAGPKPNETHAAEFAQKKMEEWFRAAGAVQVIRRPGGMPGRVHARLRWNPHGRQRGKERVNRWVCRTKFRISASWERRSWDRVARVIPRSLRRRFRGGRRSILLRTGSHCNERNIPTQTFTLSSPGRRSSRKFREGPQKACRWTYAVNGRREPNILCGS